MTSDTTNEAAPYERVFGAPSSLVAHFLRGIVVMACAMHPAAHGLAHRGTRRDAALQRVGVPHPGSIRRSVSQADGSESSLAAEAGCLTAALAAQNKAPTPLKPSGLRQSLSPAHSDTPARHGLEDGHLEPDDFA